AELLHGETDAVDDMTRSRDPDRAVGTEHALAALEPPSIEGVVLLHAAAAVTAALVDPGALSVLAGGAAVRQEVRRVGEDDVDALGLETSQHLQAVAAEQRDPPVGGAPVFARVRVHGLVLHGAHAVTFHVAWRVPKFSTGGRGNVRSRWAAAARPRGRFLAGSATRLIDNR